MARSSSWYRARPPEQQFVGLCNDGATCYLNSLLQALYILPDIRRLLFSFEYVEAVHGPPEACVPLQLARIFARLQMSSCQSTSTRALTASFGWSRAETFTQHDVQELCRVLFDCLSRFGSPVDAHFRGELRSTLRCECCGHTSSRHEPFGDVQLDISRSTDVCGALADFVASERLDGDNAWRCEVCGEHVPAHKELSFASLPPLLMLQLKRFEYDAARRSRRKLHHRVAFPLRLDMRPYTVAHSAAHTDGKAEGGHSGEGRGGEEHLGEGALLYDCVGVLLHAGSADGGHYSALLRSPTAEAEWHRFSDEMVCAVDEGALEAAQGWGKPESEPDGGSTAANTSGVAEDYFQIRAKDYFQIRLAQTGMGTSKLRLVGEAESGASCYCLLYQQVGVPMEECVPRKEARVPPMEARVPPSLENEVLAEELEAEQLRAADRVKCETVHLRLLFACDTSIHHPMISVPADTPVAELMQQALPTLLTAATDATDAVGQVKCISFDKAAAMAIVTADMRRGVGAEVVEPTEGHGILANGERGRLGEHMHVEPTEGHGILANGSGDDCNGAAGDADAMQLRLRPWDEDRGLAGMLSAC